jgi:type IV pilus assembly protein PilQ
MLHTLKPKFAATLAGLILPFLLGAPAWATNALSSLDISTGQNDSQIVKLSFKDALDTLPMHFSTVNPHRIVLDFPGTDNLLGEQSSGAMNSGVLGSYRVVKSNDRTRVVINLAGPGTYDLRKEGKLLFVAVRGVAGTPSSTPAPAPASFAAKEMKQTHTIRNIDFRRGENGSGRVEVSLSDPSVGIDIKQIGRAHV